VSMTADNGDHASGGERYLQATGGTATIRYRLYANGGSTPWAGTTLPLTFVTGAQTIPIRAVATLAGPTAAGTYTDTVRITLTW
jgi:spore coat protein U-like protein